MDKILTIVEEIKKDLQKKHYGVVGQHAGVQICEWTKKSLRNQGECYKNTFYGIDTFSCAQVSPNVIWCDQNCIFCWRPAENMLKKEIKESVMPTKELIEALVKARQKLLSGFKGYSNINKEKLKASLCKFPSHWAISLSGEPTLYPKLAEFILELKKHKPKSIFLVSNGQNPDVIKKLAKEKALPTQLYVSLDAWNRDSYSKINRGVRKDAWKRLLKTLTLLKNLKTRTVIRLTLIKGINTDSESLKKFGDLIERAQPDFLEVKAYMWLGYSRKRLGFENMPTHTEIKAYCKELEKHLPSFKYEDESKPSRIVLYINTGENRKKPKPKRWIISL